MRSCLRRQRCLATAWPVVLAFALVFPSYAKAERLILLDGRILEGKLGTVSGLAISPLAPTKGTGGRTISFIDDNLRRTFIPNAKVRAVEEDKQALAFQKIVIPQRVAMAGKRVARIGPLIKVEPFDEFGRRIVTLASDKGPLNVIQGITEITPLWTKIEGLAGKDPYIWQTSMATSSIPRDTLSKIISRAIDPTKLNDRLKLVRLMVQSDRYQEAQQELEAIVKQFPDQEELQKEIRAVRQLDSRRVIDELNLRRRSGQYRLVYNLLQNFPREGVAGEVLQQVRQMLDEYGDTHKKGETVINGLKKNLEAIKDSNVREKAKPLVEEITERLNFNTVDRMADYLRLIDADDMSDEDKLSLGISGWLLGGNHANTNLAVVLSLAETRNLIRQYLRETVKHKRGAILEKIRSQEGATPEAVARIIDHMEPPVESPPPSKDKPGFYELQVPSLDKEPNVTYYVQLPPEYDPYRHYPTIVTLNGAGTTPELQVDWWAGMFDKDGNRLGHGTRYGYIVIAVDWARPNQKEYEYSAREHDAVLASLRDACRRFAIDTDRVFLTGHAMGGDAAWDIALAHPDLWAGVIPIVAVADKYCTLCWENANLVPFYVVSGELDGDKTVTNAGHGLDRYLTHRYDTTVVEYIGRGHEPFHDEILRLFDWMGRRQRNFFPKEFSTLTMRTWDNFFWWLELADFPPATIVEPTNWPPPRNYRPMRTKASIKSNTIYVNTGADKVSVWLSPELVDLEKPVRINVNGSRLNHDLHLQPDVETMLEDVRTRADRQHPFWVKVEK